MVCESVEAEALDIFSINLDHCWSGKSASRITHWTKMDNWNKTNKTIFSHCAFKSKRSKIFHSTESNQNNVISKFFEIEMVIDKLCFSLVSGSYEISVTCLLRLVVPNHCFGTLIARGAFIKWSSKYSNQRLKVEGAGNIARTCQSNFFKTKFQIF